jgi:hypothetical protein
MVRTVQIVTKKGRPKARQVTKGPQQHWFGYHDICPWSQDQRHILSMEYPNQKFCEPQHSHSATIGIVEVDTGKFIPLEKTQAWNWQQGAMLHWLPRDPNRKIVYNDYDPQEEKLFACILDIPTRKRVILPRPISAVSSDGKSALSINFQRVGRLRGKYEYGYSCTQNDPSKGELHPDSDGIYKINLENRDVELIVPISEVLAKHPDLETEQDREMWVNHTVFNPDNSRFCFFARSVSKESDFDPLGWYGHVYSTSIMGNDLRCLVPYHPVYKEASHYSWVNVEDLCVYHRGFYGIVRDERNPQMRVFLRGVTNGHPSICPTHPDVFVSDTYPLGPFRLQKLWLYNMRTGKKEILGRYFSPQEFIDAYRCDLHPRWNQQGTHVCFDSPHQGLGRQIYIMDVSEQIAEIRS